MSPLFYIENIYLTHVKKLQNFLSHRCMRSYRKDDTFILNSTTSLGRHIEIVQDMRLDYITFLLPLMDDLSIIWQTEFG
jgi:hypothetical protein